MTRSRLIDFAGGDGGIIVSYLHLIVRAAIQSSSTTSTVKGAAAKDVILQGFSDSQKVESFDFEVGVEELDDNEPMPDDIEIFDV